VAADARAISPFLGNKGFNCLGFRESIMINSIMWKEIARNIFLVYNDFSEGVVFSPLQGKFFSSDGDALDVVNEYIRLGNPDNHIFHDVLNEAGFLVHVDEPLSVVEKLYQPTEVMISLSNSCNLRCVYCYAETGGKSQTLSWKNIVQTISQLFRYAVEFQRETVEICFHGTGETFVKWNVLVKAVNLAKTIKPQNIDLDFSVVTNGTLINDKRAVFLAENNFFVTLSLDGLEDIQNLQRPKINGKGSFDDAITGLKALLNAGVQVGIRTTVTGDNQETMPDFVKYCIELGCKNITLMPFSAVGRGADGIAPLNKEIFVRKFLEAQKIAKQFGIKLRMPGGEIAKVRSSICGACGRNCEITPEGDISCCSRVTKKDDPLSKIFFVGQVTELGFRIDQEKVNALTELNLYSYKECADCYIKYQCSGGCHYDRLSFNGMPTNWCEIAREVVWHELRDLAVTE
jgi:uncharacterized protein